MADDKPSESSEKPEIHVDSDWKRQAQEEKKRLAEEERKRAESAATKGSGVGRGPSPQTPREMPPADFATLVQSIATQVLFYVGDLAPRGGEPVINLDMAKHHIDTLALLEEKTKGNLSGEEKSVLDAALYETRMRYVAVASQQII